MLNLDMEVVMESTSSGTPVITKEDDVWVIRIASASGKTQEYRCASESKAKQLAAVLTSPSTTS